MENISIGEIMFYVNVVIIEENASLLSSIGNKE